MIANLNTNLLHVVPSASYLGKLYVVMVVMVVINSNMNGVVMASGSNVSTSNWCSHSDEW